MEVSWASLPRTPEAIASGQKYNLCKQNKSARGLTCDETNTLDAKTAREDLHCNCRTRVSMLRHTGEQDRQVAVHLDDDIPPLDLVKRVD